MWNQNSDRVLTSADNAKIFDVKTGECEGVFHGNSKKISSAVWVDNDTKVIAAEVEKCMKMWSIDGAEIHTWNTDCYIELVTCDPNESDIPVIAYYTASKINVMDLSTKQVIASLDEEEKVRSL